MDTSHKVCKYSKHPPQCGTGRGRWFVLQSKQRVQFTATLPIISLSAAERWQRREWGEGEEGFVMGFWPSKSLGPRPCRILFKVNIYMPRTQATLADNWRESWRGKMGEECEGGCGGRRQEEEEEESGRGRGRRQRQRQQILVICSCFLRPAKVSTTTTTTTTRVALHRTTTRTLKGASAGASSIEGAKGARQLARYDS